MERAMPKRAFAGRAFVTARSQDVDSSRGRLLVASCGSGDYLAGAVVDRYQARLAEAGAEGSILYLADIDFRFSDSETCVRLEADVSGCDAFLFQALFDPAAACGVDRNYVAFLAAARALREWGANHVTAVLPYLAYARQDKPSRSAREPTTAKLMADLSVGAGVDRLVTWHPHTQRLRGFYDHTPVDALDALPMFVDAFRDYRGRNDVVAIAPDAGASKLVTCFGRTLDLACAIASKHRPQPEQVAISEIIGDLAGKRVAIVLDDMISSGGTVYALLTMLSRQTGIEEVYLGVSHNLCTRRAWECLFELQAEHHLVRVLTTNSIPQTDEFVMLPFFSVWDLSETLAWVINRVHHNRSVGETICATTGQAAGRAGIDRV
jgi:ribose-phosphate pyrophosphokinase